MAEFHVYVVPRSARAGADGRHDGLPRLRVTSAPADHRANAEAERVLTRLLGRRVRLVAGARSRRKRFSVDFDESALAVLLEALF